MVTPYCRMCHTHRRRCALCAHPDVDPAYHYRHLLRNAQADRRDRIALNVLGFTIALVAVALLCYLALVVEFPPVNTGVTP